MIHILPNAAYRANSNNFLEVFRRCTTTEIWSETQTNPCRVVMHCVAVGQVTVRICGLSFVIIVSVTLRTHPLIYIRC